MYSDRALVIGAGFAGLLAARVLSESYGDVVLVERDALTTDAGHRAGLPRAHHPHPLPARGEQALEALFPRIGRELENAGAVRADLGSDCLHHFPAGPAPRDHLGLSVLSVTRVTLDRIIRRRVLRLANVSLVDGVTIDGLLHDRGAVTGVHGRRGDRPFTDYADLVVDASGRDSKLVSWLAELGVHCPAPRIVHGHVTCSSRLYEVNRDLELGWKNACEITHLPGTARGGAVSSVDGSRWLVTLFGAEGDPAPADDDGFLDHATSLRCQGIAEIVKTATPASAIHHAGTPRTRWNRFHQVPDWPRGLLAIGDSVVSLDPVHGHGLTVTALNCADLRALVREHDLAGEPLVFQRGRQGRQVPVDVRDDRRSRPGHQDTPAAEAPAAVVLRPGARGDSRQPAGLPRVRPRLAAGLPPGGPAQSGGAGPRAAGEEAQRTAPSGHSTVTGTPLDRA
ncbi:FAD-dependent oxidoreductase [Lentzea sp. NPDC051208]|uniref:FAD-dependent oxidoreductase n=1 Tax=Lentzea sp. NPDC051208 TaxID=3154642 RepID=UPI0034351AD8